MEVVTISPIEASKRGLWRERLAPVTNELPKGALADPARPAPPVTFGVGPTAAARTAADDRISADTRASTFSN